MESFNPGFCPRRREQISAQVALSRKHDEVTQQQQLMMMRGIMMKTLQMKSNTEIKQQKGLDGARCSEITGSKGLAGAEGCGSDTADNMDSPQTQEVRSRSDRGSEREDASETTFHLSDGGQWERRRKLGDPHLLQTGRLPRGGQRIRKRIITQEPSRLNGVRLSLYTTASRQSFIPTRDPNTQRLLNSYTDYRGSGSEGGSWRTGLRAAACGTLRQSPAIIKGSQWLREEQSANGFLLRRPGLINNSNTSDLTESCSRVGVGWSTLMHLKQEVDPTPRRTQEIMLEDDILQHSSLQLSLFVASCFGLLHHPQLGARDVWVVIVIVSERRISRWVARA
ncbi:unnamed protein product [Pleuronectes platessa]|uniref:Uncharacterized protein n=1 Tax=Pleuronectes platessa TaxID=8262 RepID=A0A9N7UQL8_PLEPL|nr:unnamed protein product [Pleuronectes platessa]